MHREMDGTSNPPAPGTTPGLKDVSMSASAGWLAQRHRVNRSLLDAERNADVRRFDGMVKDPIDQGIIALNPTFIEYVRRGHLMLGDQVIHTFDVGGDSGAVPGPTLAHWEMIRRYTEGGGASIPAAATLHIDHSPPSERHHRPRVVCRYGPGAACLAHYAAVGHVQVSVDEAMQAPQLTARSRGRLRRRCRGWEPEGAGRVRSGRRRPRRRGNAGVLDARHP